MGHKARDIVAYIIGKTIKLEDLIDYKQWIEDRIVSLQGNSVIQHSGNAAIATLQRGTEITCYIGFTAKARAKSWQQFVEAMTDRVELREAKRMSAFKYELKVLGLSMKQIDRLASEIDAQKSYRRPWDRETKPPTYKEPEIKLPVNLDEIEPGDIVAPLLTPSDRYEIIQVLPNEILDCKSLQTGIEMGLRSSAVTLVQKKKSMPPCPFVEGDLVEWEGRKLRVKGVGVESLHCVLPTDPESTKAHTRVPIVECAALTLTHKGE